MTTKILEVVVCDLCTKDRPAVSQRTIDVCGPHDAKLEERAAANGHVCEECGRSFKAAAGLRHHITVTHG